MYILGRNLRYHHLRRCLWHSPRIFSWRRPPRMLPVMYGSNWACSAAGAWRAFASGVSRAQQPSSVLEYSVKWYRYVQPYFNTRRPRFSPVPEESLIDHTQQLYNNPSTKNQKMSQYTIENTTFSNNTNSFNNNVQNNYAAADDRSQLLAWLSPLEPKLRHRDIQERRVDNVGEWLLQTAEFRTWHDGSCESEGDKGVLFCYGGPGVGKTFIR